MGKRILVLFLVSFFALLVFAGGALAKNKAKPSTIKFIKDTDLLRMEGGEPQPYFAPTPVMYERGITACDSIHPDTAVNVIQLDQWGTTYYDYQKNGSMGRMIAVGPAGEREMVFMRTRGPYSTTYPRYITYNCKNWSDAWCQGDSGYNVHGGTGINAGYVNNAAMHDGREVIIYHATGALAGGHPWNTALAVGDTHLACVSSNKFYNKYDIPDSLPDAPQTATMMWPKLAVMYNDTVDTDYIHITGSEGKTSGGDQRLGYLRCHLLANGKLFCETPYEDGNAYTGQAPGWWEIPANSQFVPNKSIAYFGETSPGSGDYPNDIAVLVVTSPVSKKVGMVFVNKKQSGTNQVDNDVFYFESTNNGNSWFPQYGGTWPPTIANGMLHKITNYPTNGTERAYTDLAACYDYNDNLHIVWPAIHYDPITQGAWSESKLYHWSQGTGINFIVSGYDRSGVDPGRWNMTISKPSVSAKDPIYHPPDSVYLFVTWTSFDTSDNGLDNYTNGDIYATCSNDSGRLWTKRYNLTGTHTPGCDSGGCLSEHWSSMAENMYNGDLHIEYVCDRDAGAFDGGTDTEGKCTADPMMYMHVQQIPYKGFCDVGYTIVDPIPNFTDPPIKVPIGGTRSWSFNLLAAGNLPGDYTVYTDNGLVTITGGSPGHLDPGDTATIEGLIISPGEQFIKATITISGCDGQVTYDIPLYAVGSDTNYYECARDSATFIEKTNGVCSLYVCVNSEQELWDKRWPWNPDSQKTMDAGGVIIATTNGTDTIVGRQEWTRAFTGARDTLKAIDGDTLYTEVGEPDCQIQRIYGSKTYIWTPTVIDAATSNIQWWWVVLNKRIILFHDRPGHTCPEWKKEQIIKQVWINWGRPPVWWPDRPLVTEAHQKMYFGYFADFDAPADQPLGRSANLAGFDDDRQIAWQRGWYNDTLGKADTLAHPEFDGYYMGLALTSRTGQMKSPIGAQNGMNNVYVYPNSGWVDDSLYRLASTPGVWIQDPDSVTDRIWVVTADTIKAGPATDTTWKSEFILIEALIKSDDATQGLIDLQNHIDTTRAKLIPELNSLHVFEPTLCGDVNCDGSINILDIVYLINYKYLVPPGPAPCWPLRRGDVNADNAINILDIVYLINYKYLVPPGPAPVCKDLPF
jgi:hypothetical protein